MNKPEQLRLAADIIEKGLAYEYFNTVANRWMPSDIKPDSLVASHEVKIRIKPEPVMMPLDAADVPEGIIVAADYGQERQNGWSLVLVAHREGVSFVGRDRGLAFLSYKELFQEKAARIKRPGGQWEPCSKPA